MLSKNEEHSIMRGWRRSLFRFYNLGGVGSEEIQFEAAGIVGAGRTRLRELRIYSQRDHSHRPNLLHLYFGSTVSVSRSLF